MSNFRVRESKMEIKYLGERFTIRRTAGGEVVFDWHDPKPLKKPAPNERVPAPKSEAFEFEGERFVIWKDPLRGFLFERERPRSKPVESAPLARQSKPQSVAVNIVSVKSDPHALPQRTGVARAVPSAELVRLAGRWYWVWESSGGLQVRRANR